MADVICIGAHPDDVEIGMGGTVAGLVRRGLSVLCIDLTDGEPTPRGTHEARMDEAQHAAGLLGMERVTLDLPNRSLFDTVEARSAVAEFLRLERPHLMFVPYPVDAHPDHIAASSIATAARFYGKFTKTEMRGEPHYVPRLYHYMAVHLRLVERPSFVVDVSDDLERKLEALAAYRSQFSANPANEHVIAAMEGTARMWGAMIGVAAGEPFFAPEPVGVGSVETLI